MDLISFWTAPFPENSTLAISELPDFVLNGQKDTHSPDSEDETQGVGNGSANDSALGTPALSSEESSLRQANGSLTVRRKPMPRKGHKKSRRGCYSCKKRKIKCSELKPHCENCVKAGIACEYPKQPGYALLVPAPGVPLQSSPTSFSMNDMRFFHHFIVRAYPHLPVGADHTWTMEIPAIAHQVGSDLHVRGLTLIEDSTIT